MLAKLKTLAGVADVGMDVEYFAFIVAVLLCWRYSSKKVGLDVGLPDMLDGGESAVEAVEPSDKLNWLYAMALGLWLTCCGRLVCWKHGFCCCKF